MTRLDSAQWQRLMDYLRENHGPICRQWFEELEPVGMDSGWLEIQTATNVQQNYLQNKCLDPFNEAAQHATGALVGVKFVSESTRSAKQPVGVGAATSTSGTSVPRPLPDYMVGDYDADQMVLSPDYSFDNFISGPNNRLAYAAAVAVADQPGTAYNPLFIHGGVGLGKTHLLQAICQKILNANPDYQILYVSCDAFMNQFFECVRSGKMSEFHQRYRHVDMLVIDDIHFLADKERSQEEFFHTFNELYQHNKQIVLSSDAAPNEIPKLEERLISRFNWGLVAQVGKPCFETRIAILKAKAQLRSVEVPDEVIELIASRVDTNARELEGAITNLIAHAKLQNLPIGMDLAREMLGAEPVAPRNNQVTLQAIIDAVTNFYNVKLQDLQSRRRHKSITEPRQICMWLARKNTRFSLEEIGGYFGGRDHTTVMHSIKTVDARSETDATYAAQVQQLNEQIQQQV
ncbi:MAG: chromosomal replication initiator protein DnaA [Phycisphaeraceae bacterium]|nr:chromosomal replication initiator protein DnaA [Phycisphaeraceae bacterium]